MASETPTRWTRKGLRTRDSILTAAVELIHEFGVAGTTIDDVKAAAHVSGSQLYHYFADKDELVDAVVARQAAAVVDHQRSADLGTAAGLQAWCDGIVELAARADGRGGCPLGSLSGQLAETSPHSRIAMAAGFDEWTTVLQQGLEQLRANGHLAVDIQPDALAVTLLATLQGGLLLAQVHRDVEPLRVALTTMIGLLVHPMVRVDSGRVDTGTVDAVRVDAGGSGP